MGIAALAVYLALAPGVPADKDGAEFTLVLAVDGIAHPTGYPLYTLFGHWFAALAHALGASWAYAANAWSALGGGIAVGLLHALSARLIPPRLAIPRTGRFLLALLPTLLLALNPVWSMEATFAEVYSWHQCWVLASALVFVRIVRLEGGLRDMPARRLIALAAAWGLLCGVGAAHHATAVLVAAPLSLALAWMLIRARRLTPTVILAAAAAALAPLASYLLLAAKADHPGPGHWGNIEPGLGGLWAHMTGAQYRFLLGGFAPSDAQRWYLLVYVYPFLFGGLAVLAWLLLRARGPAERWIAGGLLVPAAVQVAYAFNYAVGDPASYFLPSLGFGLASFAPLAGIVLAATRLSRRSAAAAGAVILVAVAALNVRWVHVNLSRRAGYEQFDGVVRAMWGSIPFERGFILWADDMFARLRMYQVLEGRKPALEVHNPWWLGYPAVKREFMERHGFDPLLDVPLSGQVFLPPKPGRRRQSPQVDVARVIEAIAQNINARTPLPVVIFDPEHRSVRLLRKAEPESLTVPAR